MAIIEDSTTGYSMKISDDGSAKVNLGGRKRTYTSVIRGVASAAAPTDILTITGSSSCTTKVWLINIEANQTTIGRGDIILIKRSAVNEGGTSVVASLIPFDATDIAGSSTIRTYTANPAGLGTSAGNVYATTYEYKATGDKPDILGIEFGKSLLTKAITLNGAAESLCVNLNGVTLTGGSFNFIVVITEE